MDRTIVSPNIGSRTIVSPTVGSHTIDSPIPPAERIRYATRSELILSPRANRSDPLVHGEPSDPFKRELVFSDPNRTDLATRVPNRHLDQFSPSARSDFQADHDTCPQRLI